MGTDLTGLTLRELEQLFEGIPSRSGNARHRAQVVFRAMYRDLQTDLTGMEPMAKDVRAALIDQAHVGRLQPGTRHVSSDGTIKYLFDLKQGAQVESVWIPTRWGNTLCISSQAGCAMGCTFCHTGTMGLLRNLSVAEIVGQVVAVAAERRVDGVVFMGMGEPLANYGAVTAAVSILLDEAGFRFSHNRVTVSTVGLLPELQNLGRNLPVNICVSVHSPFDDVRSTLVPANRKHALADVLSACRELPTSVRRRLILAYTLLPGVNDREQDAAALAARMEGLPNKVNLIPFNPFPDAPFRRPTDEEVEAFQQKLMSHGLRALYRTTRGEDIMGACGQLATEARRRPAS